MACTPSVAGSDAPGHPNDRDPVGAGVERSIETGCRSAQRRIDRARRGWIDDHVRTGAEVQGQRPLVLRGVGVIGVDPLVGGQQQEVRVGRMDLQHRQRGNVRLKTRRIERSPGTAAIGGLEHALVGRDQVQPRRVRGVEGQRHAQQRRQGIRDGLPVLSAVDRFPDAFAVPAHVNRGRCLGIDGEMKERAHRADIAFAIDPARAQGHPAVHVRRGVLETRGGHVVRAVLVSGGLVHIGFHADVELCRRRIQHARHVHALARSQPGRGDEVFRQHAGLHHSREDSRPKRCRNRQSGPH